MTDALHFIVYLTPSEIMLLCCVCDGGLFVAVTIFNSFLTTQKAIIVFQGAYILC